MARSRVGIQGTSRYPATVAYRKCSRHVDLAICIARASRDSGRDWRAQDPHFSLLLQVRGSAPRYINPRAISRSLRPSVNEYNRASGQGRSRRYSPKPPEAGRVLSHAKRIAADEDEGDRRRAVMRQYSVPQ